MTALAPGIEALGWQPDAAAVFAALDDAELGNLCTLMLQCVSEAYAGYERGGWCDSPEHGDAVRRMCRDLDALYFDLRLAGKARKGRT